MQKNIPRLEHLVSVRGIAAWLVVLFHSLALLVVACPGIPKTLVKIIFHGSLAVDFFFVLSGFIIFINYYAKFNSSFRKNILPFYWNRFSRIYPVHLFMLLAYLALAGVFLYRASSRSLPAAFGGQLFFENLFLVQAWGHESTSWNVPSWSVSAEWFVYLTFPLIAAGLARFAYGIRRMVALAAFVFFLVSYIGSSELQFGTTPVLMLPLVRAFHEFLLGAIAGALFIYHRDWLVRVRIFLLVAALAVLVINYFTSIPYYFLVPFLCFVSICILSVDQSRATKILSAKWLVYLGEISYSTYMVHYFIKDVFKAVFVSDLYVVNPTALFLSFAVVLIASMLMYRYLEIPAQTFLRKNMPRKLTNPVQA